MPSRALAIAVLIVVARSLHAESPSASSDANRIAALESQVAALLSRIEQLEAGNTNAGISQTSPVGNRAAVATTTDPSRSSATAPPSSAKPASASPFGTGLQWSGDLRLRFDALDQENAARRDRPRLRARIALQAPINEQLTSVFGLATGSGDPISSNQSFGDGLSRKDIRLDLAYVNWKAVEGLQIQAGKFPLNFRNVGGAALLWDSDVNPEGLALNYKQGAWFASASSWWLEERGAQAESLMLGAQTGYVYSQGNHSVTLGLGYFDFLAAQERRAFFRGNSAGNFIDAQGRYLTDFNEVELFAEWQHKTDELTLSGFAQGVRNLEGEDEDSAFALGAGISFAQYNLTYAFKSIDANALVGAYTDSDFGIAGSDIEGHTIIATLSPNKTTQFRASLFLTESGEDAGNPEDANRLQIDAQVRY